MGINLDKGRNQGNRIRKQKENLNSNKTFDKIVIYLLVQDSEMSPDSAVELVDLELVERSDRKRGGKLACNLILFNIFIHNLNENMSQTNLISILSWKK